MDTSEFPLKEKREERTVSTSSLTFCNSSCLYGALFHNVLLSIDLSLRGTLLQTRQLCVLQAEVGRTCLAFGAFQLSGS